MTFLLYGLLAALLSSVASGVVGTFVVVKRIANLSGSISHSVLGGMGLFLFLQRSYGFPLDPIYGAFLFAILSSLLLGYVHLYYREREDAVIAALWSTGMALGVLFIALTPGANVELTHFLFGNILWIGPSDLLLLLCLDIALLLPILYFYHPLLAITFDERHAKLQKVAVAPLYFLLLVLIAIAVVILLQVIGSILVIALLTLPSTIASLFAERLHTVMIASTLIAALLTLTGICLSYALNFPPGALIGILSGVAYFCTLLYRKGSYAARKPGLMR